MRSTLSSTRHLSLVTRHFLNDSRGVAGDGRARGNAACNDGARAYECALAYLDAAEYGRVAADGCAAAYDGAFESPVHVGLRRAVGARGARPSVVDEHDAVADEDLVLYLDSLADERVA